MSDHLIEWLCANQTAVQFSAVCGFLGFHKSKLVFLFAPKPPAPCKDPSPNMSTGQKPDGKEEADLKEEEKKETVVDPAEEKPEESKEEAKPDQKVKEEKPGENEQPERPTRYYDRVLLET